MSNKLQKIFDNDPHGLIYKTVAEIKARLEYLRGEIEAERISYAEIAELQSLAEYIEPGDNLLLEWAGVPENQEFNKTHTKKEIKEARQAVKDSNEQKDFDIDNPWNSKKPFILEDEDK